MKFIQIRDSNILINVINVIVFFYLAMNWFNCWRLELADVTTEALSARHWLCWRSCARWRKRHHHWRSQPWLRPTCVTPSSSPRWSAASSVCTTARRSTRSKSRLRWSDTTWASSVWPTSRSSTVDLVLVPLTRLDSSLSDRVSLLFLLSISE